MNTELVVAAWHAQNVETLESSSVSGPEMEAAELDGLLFRAVATGDVRTLRHAIGAGADVDGARNQHGQTALQAAISQRQLRAMFLLLAVNCAGEITSAELAKLGPAAGAGQPLSGPERAELERAVAALIDAGEADGAGVSRSGDTGAAGQQQQGRRQSVRRLGSDTDVGPLLALGPLLVKHVSPALAWILHHEPLLGADGSAVLGRWVGGGAENDADSSRPSSVGDISGRLSSAGRRAASASRRRRPASPNSGAAGRREELEAEMLAAAEAVAGAAKPLTAQQQQRAERAAARQRLHDEAVAARHARIAREALEAEARKRAAKVSREAIFGSSITPILIGTRRWYQRAMVSKARREAEQAAAAAELKASGTQLMADGAYAEAAVKFRLSLEL